MDGQLVYSPCSNLFIHSTLLEADTIGCTYVGWSPGVFPMGTLFKSRWISVYSRELKWRVLSGS